MAGNRTDLGIAAVPSGHMVLRRLVSGCVVVALVAACTGDDAADPETPSTLPPPTSSTTTTTTTTTSTTTTTTSTTSTTTTTLPPTTTAAPTTTVVPVVEAAAYAVYDMRSGQFLAASQADTPLPVASLIKLLAAQTAYAAGQPTKVVVAPPGLILDPEESRIGIDEGQELQRDLLIRAMLIVSANDAARMLALDIAGGEAQFAEQMNQMAGALGLANTRAVNVTGLDAEGQFSTANDMTRLAALLMRNASFQLAVRRTDAVLNEISHPATNDLLTLYPGADGIKTGRTTAAGWCIVASATRNNRRIIATVIGAPTEDARNAAATTLLDWGFTQP
jgi:D-alanyl-D-alanine carboxypeptidase